MELPEHSLTNLYRLLLATWYIYGYPVKAQHDGPVVLLGKVLADPVGDTVVKAIATYTLGMMYFLGKGVERDLSKGFSLAETAALLGDVSALYFTGSLYESGRPDIPIQQDTPKAMRFLQRAAKMGDPNAMYRLAMMYYGNINHVPDKMTEVVQLMTEAAEKKSLPRSFVPCEIYRQQ